jgi:hypothetical protein
MRKHLLSLACCQVHSTEYNVLHIAKGGCSCCCRLLTYPCTEPDSSTQDDFLLRHDLLDCDQHSCQDAMKATELSVPADSTTPRQNRSSPHHTSMNRSQNTSHRCMQSRQGI